MTTNITTILDELTTFRGYVTFLGGLLLSVAVALTLVTLQTITTPAEAASLETWQAQQSLAELARVPEQVASAANGAVRHLWAMANAGDSPATRPTGLVLVGGWKAKRAMALPFAVTPEEKRRRARPQGRTAEADSGPDADAITPKTGLAPLAPSLTNAIEKILQLASRAAMTGRTDRDLLNAFDAISGEIRAAEHEYHGPPDDEGHDEQDIPF